MNSFSINFETTRDNFFAGKLTILQPKNGFRAGLDSLLLAASINFPKSHSDLARATAKREAYNHAASINIMELGSGAGVAALALAYRTNTHIIGIEINPELVALSTYNAQLNGLNVVEFLQGDATNPKTFTARGQDVVMFNPPFYDSQMGQSSPNAQKAKATHVSDAHLSAWVSTAITCLKSGGEFVSIIPPERLQIMLAAIGNNLGAIEILPIHSKPNQPALRVIIKGKKGRKTPLKLLPAFYTQDENGAMTAEMRAIAEDGKCLN